jgi:hypothetical protein
MRASPSVAQVPLAPQGEGCRNECQDDAEDHVEDDEDVAIGSLTDKRSTPRPTGCACKWRRRRQDHRTVRVRKAADAGTRMTGGEAGLAPAAN